jgi:PAS domain S-box-containing protein
LSLKSCSSEPHRLEPTAHLAAIIHSCEDAIISKDRNGTITWWNPSATRMFGWSEEEAIGHPITIIIPESLRDEEARMRDWICRGEIVRHYETVRTRKDGNPIDISLALSPIKNASGVIVGVSKIARDITGRKKSDTKFRDYLEAAPDGVIVVDGEGRIVTVNSQTERLFRYSRTELLGQRVEMLVPSRFAARHARDRAAYSADPKARTMGSGLELYGLRRDGTEFPLEISLSPIDTEDGTLTISTIRDISDRKAADAERARLLHERAANLEANRIKDEFLATLSHELRTPLNGILGWNEMLLKGILTPERTNHALLAIQRNARAQSQLIEDLLDVSRVITGKLHLDSAPLDVVHVVVAAADVVRPSAQAKGLELEVLAELRPLLVLGDAGRLQQAVWNLLTNAIKFTPKGGRIDVRVAMQDAMAVVVVRDTGRGIDPAFLPHVFDRFRQEDSSVTRAYGGLGLGLALVRSIVEAHGGSVHASSAGADGGAMFRLEIPVGVAHERRLAPDRSDEATADLRGVRVLIVDDTADERELFSEILSRAGAHIETAENARSALTLLERSRPDIILSDIGMPSEDGYTFMRKVRAHPDHAIAATPAVAVTAHAHSEDRRNAFTAGFQRYIAKPVSPDELLRTVAALRASSRAR